MSDDGEDVVITADDGSEWTQDHARLLYMMSLYAKCAQSAQDREGWIRELPLTVLMYEAITKGVIDLDYAPSSRLVTVGGRSRRIWLNVTQEGRAAIDDLREKGMINGLKLSTEDFQPVTAYQVSHKGLSFIRSMAEDVTDPVDEFLHFPRCDPDADGAKEAKTELITVGFDTASNMFKLSTASGSYERESEVSETEDVSYVSSPYLPKCIRATGGRFRDFTSNAHRSHESAAGGSNIQDELDEAVVLGHVHAMVGEWIPFGSNQIVALNERLGALDRCQGGLFTAMVDKSPTDTQFAVPPGLTQVTILDYDFVHFINFEAEINYPEEEGIVQVENFGMHLNVDGTIIYGVKIEAIIDRGVDDISIDHLSRLLVDVHQDSSSIMNDLLSQYQRSLLDMIFSGDMMQRNKFNLILAEVISPKMPADEYMDKGEHENELKQVLGDLRACHDLGPDDIILIGRDGVLIAGPNSKKHEFLLVKYLSLLVREIFIRNFFVRTFMLDDSLSKIRKLIMTYIKDPNNIARIRDRLNDASRDIILLKEVLEYLRESLEEMALPKMPADQAGKRLFKVLDVAQMREDIMLRCSDLDKLIDGSHHELLTLQQMTDVINTKQLEDVFKNVEANTKYLVDASAANERASASLEVMQIILAGSFAFDIIDRLSGGTLNIVVPNWIEEYIVKPVISVPGLFWLLNMAWLGLVSVLLTKLMKYLAAKAAGALTLRVKVNRKINLEHLRAFLTSRSVDVFDRIEDTESRLLKMTWVEVDAELWKGSPPAVELQYDDRFGFLLSVFFQIDTKTTPLRERGLMDVFNKMMADAGVFEKDDEAADG